MTYYIRNADGTCMVTETYPPPCGCHLERGHVCDHGTRLDLRDLTMNGDGCIVVAVDRDVRRRKIAWEDALNATQRAQLVLLNLAQEVEVLLDDGRVIRTRTRSVPFNVNGRDDDVLVLLDRFVGGYSITRLRLPDWAWDWTVRLPAVIQ